VFVLEMCVSTQDRQMKAPVKGVGGKDEAPLSVRQRVAAPHTAL